MVAFESVLQSCAQSRSRLIHKDWADMDSAVAHDAAVVAKQLIYIISSHHFVGHPIELFIAMIAQSFLADFQ